MDDKHQLSLFEQVEGTVGEITEVKVKVEEIVNDLSVPLEVGDRVHIPEHKRHDSESFFYIQEFIKKRGTVLKVLGHAKLQYEVEIGNKIAIIYHDELLVGWP